MAVITAVTKIAERVPYGRHFKDLLRFTIANANAADEWLALGVKQIVGVAGVVPFGTADIAEVPSFVLNARGTGVAAGTNMGDLGVEGNAAVWDVEVIYDL